MLQRRAERGEEREEVQLPDANVWHLTHEIYAPCQPGSRARSMGRKAANLCGSETAIVSRSCCSLNPSLTLRISNGPDAVEELANTHFRDT